MRQLKEIAKECSFTNSDEFVKFLFLTHNQNSRVRDALLDRMKATDTPAQCLAIAKTVESTIETEKLSKSFLQNISKPESTEVNVVAKRKGFKGPGHKQSRGQQQCSNSRSVKKCQAYGKECFSCKKKGHFKQFCRSCQHNHSQSHGDDSRKSRKDMHDIDQDDETSFQMQDYDSINVRTVHFTTDVHQTAHTNIAFDKILSDRKLQHLLTDVKLSNGTPDSPGIGVSSTARIKLDTGACGNLLPINIYKKIHPQVSIKDLYNTIDKRVCLEAYNKSEIKQLGTCHLTVGHGKCAKLCHFYIVPDYCRPILGLNDIHSLSLIAIKCDVTDKWSTDSLRPMGSSSIVDAVEEQSGSVLSKEQIINGRFKRILSGVGRFPIEPVDIVLSEDNEALQKPARRVPVAMKEKFRKELQSMAKAGIISKLDRNTLAEQLCNSEEAK